MDIHQIIMVLENRLISLNDLRRTALTSGDLSRLNDLDADLQTTKNSIATVKKALELELSTST
jgi:hypothetical protein